MELDGKEIKENEQLTDAQLADLHKQYEALWDKLKKDNYRTEHQFMEVLYEEPDNSQTMKLPFSLIKFVKILAIINLTS